MLYDQTEVAERVVMICIIYTAVTILFFAESVKCVISVFHIVAVGIFEFFDEENRVDAVIYIFIFRESLMGRCSAYFNFRRSSPAVICEYVDSVFVRGYGTLDEQNNTIMIENVSMSAILSSSAYTSKGGKHSGLGLKKVSNIIGEAGGNLVLPFDDDVFCVKAVFITDAETGLRFLNKKGMSCVSLTF